MVNLLKVPYQIKVYVILASLFLITSGRSETDWRPFQSKAKPVRIFIDCQDCDLEYLRNETGFVDHVRDPNLAEVHVLISAQGTAAGGEEFSISFLGREEFENMNFKLTYTSLSTDTEADTRSGLLRAIKMGLMPYVANSSEALNLTIQYDRQGQISDRTKIYDPWNFWVFYLELGGGLRAEESRDAFNIDGSVRADRITDVWRWRSEFFYRYEEENFMDDEEEIRSTLRQWEGSIQLVYSLSQRWSTGISADIYSTTYRNISLGSRVGLAIEYNIFPWSQSDYRIFTFAYEVGLQTFDYIEETIYDKYSENLAYHAGKMELEFIQPWGTTEIDLEARQFLAKPDMYGMELQSDFSIRITGGLSFFLEFDFEIIHDQIYLPKGDATREEILLKRRQLATTYEYEARFGIRFTFGSIYNNIVNRRL